MALGFSLERYGLKKRVLSLVLFLIHYLKLPVQASLATSERQRPLPERSPKANTLAGAALGSQQQFNLKPQSEGKPATDVCRLVECVLAEGWSQKLRCQYLCKTLYALQPSNSAEAQNLSGVSQGQQPRWQNAVSRNWDFPCSTDSYCENIQDELIRVEI
ncbi:hypothetical protein BTVI_45731 [Pitangus sulphuratus]|nr:hypothetical protein BTVI_45731 [Pitangus sulphuratus]